MEVHRSARKHGVADGDAVQVAMEPVYVADIGEDPHPGFTDAGVRLEVVVLTGDDARELVIHAMRAHRQYEALLDEQGW